MFDAHLPRKGHKKPIRYWAVQETKHDRAMGWYYHTRAFGTKYRYPKPELRTAPGNRVRDFFKLGEGND